MSEKKEQLVLCKEEGLPPIQVRMIDDSAWLTQAEMAELFGKNVATINEHLKNIFNEEELDPDSVIRNSLITAQDGKQYKTRLYNLDVIISIGYRVNSVVGTRFRKWATKRLNQYITKGYVIDDARFVDPTERDLDALTESVRKIRTSERVFYVKVRDIFAMSTDYSPTKQESRWFFSLVQNQFHYAITGMTAAELVMKRVNVNDEHMGLTTWSGNSIKLSDATNAKNYLSANELKRMELLVEQFLIFAELRSLEGIPMTMQGWLDKVNAFFVLNEKPVLKSLGEVSHDKMKDTVEGALRAFNEEKGMKATRQHKRLTQPRAKKK